MRKFLLAILLSLGWYGQAFAITPNQVLDGDLSSNEFWNEFVDLSLNTTYQIGSEWGKKEVTPQDLQSDVHFARMAAATAKVRSGGTGFYLGYFNGKHVMASNHHVCPTENACKGARGINFPLLNLVTNVVEFYGTWPEIDLSLFAINVPVDRVKELVSVASPFAFEEDVYHGEPLVTIGFGVANNPNRNMVANRDSDCMVYSKNAEYRLMADPDDLNPGPYRAWSFANGCDVSHGDSGSAMMDRNTGAVVGIIWTGRIPKDQKVQNPGYLGDIFKNGDEEIWNQLSYSVPAVKMKEFLANLVSSGTLPADQAKTISEMIQAHKK